MANKKQINLKDTKKENNKNSIERIKSELLSNNTNVVIIFGAGASVKSGIPAGKYILEKMKNELVRIKDTAEFKQKLGDKWGEANRSLLKYSMSKNSDYFEYILGIYGKFYGYDGLHEWLNNLIPKGKGEKTPIFPTFAHEYCSHLVNSGMLKYFISLNFDEILESALADELGYENFQVIASKSEFQRHQKLDIEKWRDEYNIKPECFVLKPHGTISRALTLRHIPEKVQVLEDEKREVLTKVMKNALIIFIGFSNYNENFWLLFGETYSRGLTDDIIIVGREESSIKSIRKNFPDNKHNKQIFEYIGNIENEPKIIDNEGTINRFFSEINDSLSQDKNYSSYRQMPTRHYIRGLFFDLFSRELTKGNEEDYRNFHKSLEKIPKSWFAIRLYELELLIYLIKTRGLFIQTSTDCLRIREAFGRCMESCSKEKINCELRPPKVLEEILNPNLGVNTQNKIFDHTPVKDRLKLETFYREWCFILFSRAIYLKSKIKNEDLLEENDKLFNEIAARYCNWLLKCLNDEENRLQQNSKLVKTIFGEYKEDNSKFQKFKKELSTCFKDLYSDFDVDVSGPDVSTTMRFACPEPLDSRKKMLKKTKDLLRSDWNRLRVSTVSAEWIEKELRNLKLKPRKCTIDIVANLDMFTKKGYHSPSTTFSYLNLVKSIEKLLNGLKKWEDLTINWHAYRSLEHHMTIFSNQKDEEKFKGAIYFNRPGKRTSISPIYVEKNEDIKTLLNYFDEKLVPGTDYLKENEVYGKLFTATVKRGKIELEIPNNPCYVIEHLTETLLKYNRNIKIKTR